MCEGMNGRESGDYMDLLKPYDAVVSKLHVDERPAFE